MRHGTRRSLWRWTAGGMLALVAVAIPAGADAGTHWGPGGMRGGGAAMLSHEDREGIAGMIGKRLQERLGLTQEQWESLRAAVRASREAARPDVTALRQARVELRMQMANPAGDPAGLKAAAARVKELQGKLFDRRIETALAVRSILTPEQWEQWHSLRRGRGGPYPARRRF